MRDTDKALYYCNTHPNLFSQKNCKLCSRGMCHTCINNNTTVCASCIKDSYFTVDYYSNRDELKNILIIGGIVFAAYSIFFYFAEYKIEQINLLWSLVIGIAIGSCYYLVKNVSLYSETNKIPFIGFKLTLIIIGVTFALGIPLFYFTYKVLLLLKVSYKKPESTGKLGKF